MTGLMTAVWGPRFAQGDPAVANTGLVYVTAHEVGHAVQTINPAADTLLSDSSDRKPSELEADRLSGQFMCGSGEYTTDEITRAVVFIGGMPKNDRARGTPEERAQSFRQGAIDAGCTV